MPQDNPSSDDFTVPARKRRLENVTHFSSDAPSTEAVPQAIPWALQHYFDGEIDLNKEMIRRFPQIPVMSIINTREVGSKTRRGVATLFTQDGAAGLIAEIDVPSRAVQFTFTISSMLALRFSPGRLTQMDRAGWIEPLRRESGEITFLWDQTRWENDYLIGSAQKTFTNVFAFSPHHIEAAARFTPEVARKLLDWLEFYWR